MATFAQTQYTNKKECTPFSVFMINAGHFSRRTFTGTVDLGVPASQELRINLHEP